MAQHLGLQVSAYVDRSLDPATLLSFDRHLVACEVCRHAADQERRLLASLRPRHAGRPVRPAGLAAVARRAPAGPAGPRGRAGRRADGRPGRAAAAPLAAPGRGTRRVRRHRVGGRRHRAGRRRPGAAPATPLRPSGARSGAASLTLPGGSTQLLTQVTPPSAASPTATAVPAALRAPVAVPRTASVTLPEPMGTTRSDRAAPEGYWPGHGHLRHQRLRVPHPARRRDRRARSRAAAGVRRQARAVRPAGPVDGLGRAGVAARADGAGVRRHRLDAVRPAPLRPAPDRPRGAARAVRALDAEDDDKPVSAVMAPASPAQVFDPSKPVPWDAEAT